jgi:predicted transcriptional regulator
VPFQRLPAPVRRLLEGPIDTFEKLELVLALFRSDKPLTMADLERTIELDLDQIRIVVNELVRAGFVTVEAAEAGELKGAGQIVRIVPKAEQGAALNELAKLYEDDSVVVVKALSQISMDRIRGMAARTFADAFQLRRKPEDDDG